MKLSRNVLVRLLPLVVGGLATLGLASCVVPVSSSVGKNATGPITFNQMVSQALAEVPVISAADAYQQLQKDPNTLIIDVRDASDLAVTGVIPGAVNISLGSLTYKADNEVPQEWRDPHLADRGRPIITTCETGEMAALGGKLLKDMGFTNVHTLKGGTVAWKEAGYPTNAP